MPLGSIQDLPAESCAEIKASEGNKVAESRHWLYSDENSGQAVLATCQGESFCVKYKSLNSSPTRV